MLSSTKNFRRSILVHKLGLELVDKLERIAVSLSSRIESRGNFKTLIVDPSKLRDAVRQLVGLGYNYLLSISGVDEPQMKRIRLLYHFTKTQSPQELIALEVHLPRDNPVVDSISDIFEGALLQEREVHEMLGVSFKGNPDMRHLLLPPDWPDNVYPLRKDFKVVEESHISTKPGKPIWVLKPELKPREGKEGGDS